MWEFTEVPSGSLANALQAAIGERDQYVKMVRRRAGSRVDAEEVVHTALQRAIERSGQLRDASRAHAWVGQIVLNVLRDELRKPRMAAMGVDNIDIAATEDYGVHCRCTLVQAQRLKPAYATILRRVVIDGAAVTAVAAELGLTPNNAMVRLHRARAALRGQLKAHCGMTTAQSCSDCGCEERGCCSTVPTFGGRRHA